MGTLKSKQAKDKQKPYNARRSFMWKMGAGMSVLAAAAVPGIAKAGLKTDPSLKERIAGLSGEVARLEHEKAIQQLKKEYEYLLDNGKYEELPELFTDGGEVIFNGGIFKGKNTGIRRLFCHQFKTGLTGKRMEPAPGFGIDQKIDIVKISEDGNSALASFSYSMQVGAPIKSDSILVKMARLQGEGIMKWWEGGICEISCSKDRKNKTWKIKKLEYRGLSKADFKPGRGYAKPIDVPLFNKKYPEDPIGPDRLII